MNEAIVFWYDDTERDAEDELDLEYEFNFSACAAVLIDYIFNVPHETFYYDHLNRRTSAAILIGGDTKVVVNTPHTTVKECL